MDTFSFAPTHIKAPLFEYSKWYNQIIMTIASLIIASISLIADIILGGIALGGKLLSILLTLLVLFQVLLPFQILLI